jgi:hypothetical protein
MKKFWFVTLCFCIFSCENDPLENENDVLQKILKRIEDNSIMTVETQDRTFAILELQADLTVLTNTYKTRESFIAKMEDLTKNVVDESIEQTASGTQWGASVYQWSPSDPTVLKGLLTESGVGLQGPSPGTGVLDRYSDIVDDQLARKQGEQILIDSYSLGGSSTSTNYPREQLTFSFTEIARIKASLESMILQFPKDTDLDREIESFTAANKPSAILISLLIPAVQRVREVAGPTKNSYEKMNDLIFGTTAASAERTLWNQQMKQVALLAAVSAIVSDTFNNDDENYASIIPQIEMHHATTVLAWARVYDTH